MNKDQISGKVDQAVGKVKEKVGEGVGNQRLANQGVADQVKGATKETWGNVKEASHEMASRQKHEAEAEATHTRENVTGAVQNIKDRVNDKIDEHRAKATDRRPA